MTPVNRGLAALFALQFFSGFLVAPLFALFPVFVEGRLGLTADFSGNLRAFFVVTSGLMALAGGPLMDRMGRKPAYVLGMTGVLTSGLLFLVAEFPGMGFAAAGGAGRPGAGLPMPGSLVMVLIATYAGLMFGLGAVAGQAYLMAAAPAHALARATAGYFITGTLGNALGSISAGELVHHSTANWSRLGLGMVGGELLLMLFALRWLPATPVACRDGAGAGDAAPSAVPDLPGRGVVSLLMGLRGLPTIYWGVTTLLMPLLLFRATGSEAWAGNYTAASLVLSAACQAAAGRFVDRFGPTRLMTLCVAVIAGASVLQALCVRQPWLLSLAGLVGAGAAWSLSVTMPTVVRGLSTPAGHNRLLGYTHGAWSAGFLAGTLLAGYLARNPGEGATAFSLSAGAAGAALACALGVVAALRRRAAVRPG